MMYLLVPGLACALPDPLAQKVYFSHDLRITQIYAIKPQGDNTYSASLNQDSWLNKTPIPTTRNKI